MRRPTGSTAIALAVLGLAAAGCGESRAPVAGFEARPARLELPWPELREIELAFEPVVQLPPGGEPPIVFVHLLDEPGSVVRTFDHPLPGDWKPGQAVRYTVRLHQSALADPLPAGEYLLSAGLYRPGDDRFALRTAAEEVAPQEYRIATVEVPAPAERMPHARFSETWRPAEPGADRQIVARRTLAGGATGTIQFGPVEGAGRLHLLLRVPEGNGSHERLEVLDGGPQPKIRIGSTCGGGQPELAGTGRFDVDLDLPAAAGPRICEITIATNFQVTSPERTEPDSVRLEVLAWAPEADEEAR